MNVFQKFIEATETKSSVVVISTPGQCRVEVLVPTDLADAGQYDAYGVALLNITKEVYGISDVEYQQYVDVAKEYIHTTSTVVDTAFSLESEVSDKSIYDTFYYNGVPIIRSETFAHAEHEIKVISSLPVLESMLPEGITVKSNRPSL